MALTDQTYLQLITRLAHEMNDCIAVTATSNGTTTTFVDNVNINASRESYDGWEWFGTSSPNLDVIATVTGTSSATITFTPAITTTASTNTALLVNKRGRGFRIQEYKRAINGAIQDFNGTALIPTIEAIAAAFDADDGTVAMPSTLAEAYRVEYQDSQDRWREVRRALSPGADGWTAEPSGAVIRIEGPPKYEIDGYDIRIHGYKRQSLLSALTDVCSFDSGGIVARAAYRLTMAALDRDPKYAQQLLIFRQEADEAMSRLRVLRQPGTVQVRI
jgi:hypothetical protein